MSIARMINAHPDVDGNLNEDLALAVRHAMFCAAICNSCADACLAEDEVERMRQCVRVCLDCADICTATAAVATRRTGSNEEVIRAMLKACIEACEICAEECERHAHMEHCARCAEMCHECAEDCRRALPTVGRFRRYGREARPQDRGRLSRFS